MDGFTGRIVDTGPESSANVEIVVLEGDFDGDEGNKWTVEEFENNIVRERNGKRPLLTGDGVVKLKDGVGLVGEIVFSDNSSWTRSRRFRLGARVMDKFEETRIREAKTESFVVKDHRGECEFILSQVVWLSFIKVFDVIIQCYLFQFFFSFLIILSQFLSRVYSMSSCVTVHTFRSINELTLAILLFIHTPIVMLFISTIFYIPLI